MSDDPFFQEWRRFLAGQPLTGQCPAFIRESWQRCAQAGLSPTKEPLEPQLVASDVLADRLAAGGEMVRIAAPHLKWAMASLTKLPHAIILADADGVILYSVGTAPDLMQAWGLVPGYDFSEAAMGTNGIGTALRAQHPVLVAGAAHYCEALHPFTCVGAPIRNASGRIVGAVDICTAADDTNPERLVLAAHLAYIVERELAAGEASLASLLEQRRHALLLEASSLLHARLEPQAVAEALARVSVPRLGDGCLVVLASEAGGRHALACESAQDRVRIQQRLETDAHEAWITTPSAGVVAVDGLAMDFGCGMPRLPAATLPGALQGEAVRACVMLPLLSEGRILGRVAWWWGHDGSGIDPAAGRLAEELAERAAQALALARLHHLLTDAHARQQRQIGIVSHELRNALNVVTSGATLLKAVGPLTDQQQVTIEAIQGAAGRMARFLNDLQDQSSIDAGRLTLRLAPGDPVAIVERAVSLVTPLAAAGNVTLRTTPAPEMPTLRCDSDRLVQVLVNLLANAIQHSPPGGEVAMRMATVPGGIALTVRDGGDGIGSDELDHLFEPYWRSGRNHRPGSGLGLSIGKAIVDGHAGRIEVDSTLGAGSRFTVILPTDYRDESAGNSCS